MKAVTLAAVSLSLLFAVGCSAPTSSSESDLTDHHAEEATNPIANFGVVVDNGIYRGARPGDAGLAYLHDTLGVKTDIDLEIGDFVEAFPSTINHERDAAADVGIEWDHEPMSAFWVVDDDQMNDILATLADPDKQPIYVHCKHGQDRTGLVIGLERVFNEGWDPKDAYDEMLAYGFHPGFAGLKHYYEEKTGYDP